MMRLFFAGRPLLPVRSAGSLSLILSHSQLLISYRFILLFYHFSVLYASFIFQTRPNFYYKKNMKIRLSETGKMIDAFVYIMHEERRLGIPTPAYVSTCKFGYTIFGFDFKYLDESYEKSLKGAAHYEN